MTQREAAKALVDLICERLGVDPDYCPNGGKEGLVSDVEYWLRDHPAEAEYHW